MPVTSAGCSGWVHSVAREKPIGMIGTSDIPATNAKIKPAHNVVVYSRK